MITSLARSKSAMMISISSDLTFHIQAHHSLTHSYHLNNTTWITLSLLVYSLQLHGLLISISKLKLINHLCATCWTPHDYWQTDNSNGLVMVIRNYHWLNSASWVLYSYILYYISTCSAPPQFSLFDLDLWPTTLTCSPRLAKVKVDPHAKIQGQRSNGSHRRVLTDKRTDRHYQAYYSPCYAVDNCRAQMLCEYVEPYVAFFPEAHC